MLCPGNLASSSEVRDLREKLIAIIFLKRTIANFGPCSYCFVQRGGLFPTLTKEASFAIDRDHYRYSQLVKCREQVIMGFQAPMNISSAEFLVNIVEKG